MPDAFVMAGAPTVVASLWPVSTYATTDLVIAFYEAYAGGRTGAADALARARGEMIRGRRGRYAHPFFRAPFLLFGDWR